MSTVYTGIEGWWKFGFLGGGLQGNDEGKEEADPPLTGRMTTRKTRAEADSLWE